MLDKNSEMDAARYASHGSHNDAAVADSDGYHRSLPEPRSGGVKKSEDTTCITITALEKTDAWRQLGQELTGCSQMIPLIETSELN